MDVLTYAFLVTNALSAQMELYYAQMKLVIRDKGCRLTGWKHGRSASFCYSAPRVPTVGYPTGISTWLGSDFPFPTFTSSSLKDSLGDLLAAVLDVRSGSRS